MAEEPPRQPKAVFAVLSHAWLATRVRSAEGVEACHADLSRVRDFLQHAPPTPIVTARLQLSADEASALRGGALEAMRNGCQACGLCREFGVKPP